MALQFPDIDPVIFEIGPLVIRWYAVAYIAGIIIGWRMAMKLAERYEPKRPNAQDMDDFVLWAIISIILGGRIGYVLFYQPGHYLENPLEAIKVWKGGMAFHGGLLGVTVAMIAFARVKQISLLRLSDIVACVTPIGLFFGRIANFINAELYGRVTDVPWAFIFPTSDGLPRHPSQLYQAALEGAALFIILMILARNEKIRSKPGILTGVFLAGYGLARGFVEFFREPDQQIGLFFNLFSMGQILCVPMILLGIALILFAKKAKETTA